MKNVIERVLNLLAFLLTAGRPVPADEIRQTVAGYDQESDAAFHRMFERDKDLLRRLGIPIEIQATDGWQIEQGYVISPDRYRLPEADLTDEERAALWLAAQVVRIGGRPAGPDAILKLGGGRMTAAVEPFAASLGAEVDTLSELYQATTERRTVTFRYRDRARLVAPHGIGHARGHWYLVGVETGETRVYRVDRMGGLEVGEDAEAFVRTPGVGVRAALAAQPWETGSDRPVTARVRFDEQVAWWAVRRLGRGEVTQGPVEIDVEVANRPAFVGWIISFGPDAEVLSPPDLRQAVIDKVRESA